ncbi:MAG: aminopeptidase, partial [Luminiphilus sp.]
MKPIFYALAACLFASTVHGEVTEDQPVGSGAQAFAQLEQLLPSPSTIRTASGAPGHGYWQQQVDYTIDAILDEKQRQITATAFITYANNSPDSLSYLWLQLDQNRFRPDSLDRRSRTESVDRVSFQDLRDHQSMADNTYGYQDLLVTGQDGSPLPLTIIDTMGRLDLDSPLAPGSTLSFTISWRFNITEEAAIGGRSGYEIFEDSDTQIFFLAQWFPRLAAYTDYMGWQNKAFLGRGEFTLEFGDYDVSLTVPDNHVLSATGVLQNPEDVLTQTQQQRLKSVGDDAPSFIITPEEAAENEKTQS